MSMFRLLRRAGQAAKGVSAAGRNFSTSQAAERKVSVLGAAGKNLSQNISFDHIEAGD